MSARPVKLASLLLAGALPLSATAADRPNIIYILADDLGYGDLGCYNASSKIPTPNLDRLARQGMRFTDAHASASVCTPSRYGILTGRYSFRTRLKSGVLKQWDIPLIDEGRLTVPALLRQSGYATACIGKWHLGWTWPTRDGAPPASDDGLGNIDFTRSIANGPTTRGFDYFFGMESPNFPPYVFIENDRTLGLPDSPARLQEGGMNRPGPMLPGWNQTEVMPELTRRAVRYVEAATTGPARQPFFLYFPLTAPHYPIVPAAEFKGRSQAGGYGDYVVQVDATVGAVMDALERTGQADNTLVIFSSDNGPEVLEFRVAAYARIQAHGHHSMGDLRGTKRDTWEGGHRVPFIARWPGRIPAATENAEPICEIDLMATCAALLRVPLPADAGEDSANILPLLLGEKPAGPARPAIVLHSGNGKFGIRRGDWVFIDAPTGSGNNPKGAEPEWFKQERGYEEDSFSGKLYNLRDDPAERRNLYGERPEIIRELKTLLDEYRTSGRSTPLP